MARYKVLYSYSSRGPGHESLGPWTVGAEVELEDAVAEWVNRDSAGTLAPVVAAVEVTSPPPPPAEVPNDVPAAVVEASLPGDGDGDEDESSSADPPAGPPQRDRPYRSGRRR